MHTHSSEARDAARRQASAVEGGSWLRRIAPALGVFLMAPFTAEYLLGYDTSTGNLGALLFGLLFFGPLYGGPALIIRETARRTGRGWPTMILLGLAFGIVQAGLIDHSLFNTSYRDIEYWDDMLWPTYIPALGIGADTALEFIVGHAIWSFSVPIALVETLVPKRTTRPWLGRFGMTIVVILYILVAALIFRDHVETEQFLPSTPQFVGAGAVVVALVVAAFMVGSRSRPLVTRAAPGPWLTGTVAFVALSLRSIIEVAMAPLGGDASFLIGWWGVALRIVLLAVLALVTVRWSGWTGWGAAHRLALAGGALLSHVWLAFIVEPLGDVALAEKLAHNVVLALCALALLALGARAANRTQSGLHGGKGV